MALSSSFGAKQLARDAGPRTCQLQPKAQVAARRSARSRNLLCRAAATKEKSNTQVDDDEYVYTPKGKRFKKPKNAFERLLFDFYFKPPEMSEWEKKLNAFTVENFSGGIRDWASIHTELRARKLKTVKPEAVAPQVKRKPSPLDALLGPPPLIVDVRDAEDFARDHPSGAVNVPLYTRMKEPRNAYEWYRTISFAIGLGMRPPVRNKQFLEQLAGFTGGKKDTPIFVICGPGGTLETKDERKLRDPRLPAPIFGQYGAASRSLIAAHDMLVNGGYKTVSHVEGGYAAWCSRRLDIE